MQVNNYATAVKDKTGHIVPVATHELFKAGFPDGHVLAQVKKKLGVGGNGALLLPETHLRDCFRYILGLDFNATTTYDDLKDDYDASFTTWSTLLQSAQVTGTYPPSADAAAERAGPADMDADQ